MSHTPSAAREALQLERLGDNHSDVTNGGARVPRAI